MTEYSEGYKNKSRPDKAMWDPLFASPYWVYGSILGAWVLDLFPWSKWPFMPSFLVLTLIFWTIYQPHRIYYWLVFLIGLVVDTQNVAVFGQNSLALLVVVFLTELMSERLQWLQKVGQAINILPICLIPPLLMTIESFCLGVFRVNWEWYSQALMGVVLWPAIAYILSRRFMPIQQ